MPRVRGTVEIKIYFDDLFELSTVKFETFVSVMKQKPRQKFREKLLRQLFERDYAWLDQSEVNESLRTVSRKTLRFGECYTMSFSRLKLENFNHESSFFPCQNEKHLIYNEISYSIKSV